MKEIGSKKVVFEIRSDEKVFEISIYSFA